MGPKVTSLVARSSRGRSAKQGMLLLDPFMLDTGEYRRPPLTPDLSRRHRLHTFSPLKKLKIFEEMSLILTGWARLFQRNVVTNLALIYLGIISFS
jgi:hypothetical protein